MPATAAKTKLLFVCSRNRWRSPTAEALFMDPALIGLLRTELGAHLEL